MIYILYWIILVLIFLIIFRYKDVIENSFYLVNLRKEIFEKESELEKLKENEEFTIREYNAELLSLKYKKESEIEAINIDIDYAKSILKPFEQKLFLVEHWLYDPIFDYMDSDEYKEAILNNKEEQKEFIKEWYAINTSHTFTMNWKESTWNKLIKNIIKLSLKAFNGECDSLIYEMKKSKQYGTLNDKIDSLANQIDKMNKEFWLTISNDFIDLKKDELSLNYEYLLKKEEELEEQRLEKLEARELELAQRELEREEERLFEIEEKNKRELKELQKQLKNNADNKKLLLKIEALEGAIKDLDLKRLRIKSQAELTKSWYVYIISNIWSFWERIFKIWMTRRLDPMDRVKELSDASVPFKFDVHSFIFSNDAPALENKIHKIFEKRRVNKINNKKEFFVANIDEIENIIKKIFPNKNIPFVKIPEAKEYRETKSINDNKNWKN